MSSVHSAQLSTPEHTDVQVADLGTLCALTPLSPLARAWLAEHAMTESWQWFGGSVYVEARFVADLVAGMQDAGLKVRRV